MLAPLINNFWYLLWGAGATVLISVTSIVFSALIGIFVALLNRFGGLVFRIILQIYIYVCRGVPLLVFLFTMYFVLPFININLQPTQGAIFVISIYFGAFMSEVFRAALLSIPTTQWDASRSLGMTRKIALIVVIFPQACRIALPPFINLCAFLVKDTSLVSVIGLWELTMAGRETVNRTFAAFQIFGGVAIIYFILCYSLSRLGGYLEGRLSYVH
jgi:His/Glu/Gln/Arg/opine family amino acid ABC transporter permease subunit